MRVDDLDEEIASSKGRLTYLKTDILSMPLPNPKFNLITDYYGPMTYSTKPDEILRQYYNCLQPSGLLFICFNKNAYIMEGSQKLHMKNWVEAQISEGIMTGFSVIKKEYFATFSKIQIRFNFR